MCKVIKFIFQNIFYIRSSYSQANLESKLLSAIPNACKAHIGKL